MDELMIVTMEGVRISDKYLKYVTNEEHEQLVNIAKSIVRRGLKNMMNENAELMQFILDIVTLNDTNYLKFKEFVRRFENETIIKMFEIIFDYEDKRRNLR